MAQGQGGGGVAHWAHVWGFIFGMAAAAVIGRLGIDRWFGAGPAESRDEDTGALDAGSEVRVDWLHTVPDALPTDGDRRATHWRDRG